MAPIRMERLESGVRTILAFTDAFNRRDLPAMLGFISEECVFEPSSPAPQAKVIQGKTAIIAYWEEFFTRFSQSHLKIEEAFGFGMRCISRWSCDRTEYSRTTYHLRGVDLFRIHEGLITEHLSYIKE